MIETKGIIQNGQVMLQYPVNLPEQGLRLRLATRLLRNRTVARIIDK